MNQGIMGDDTESTALMLILDVKTQWSSTRQMLCVCYYFILLNVCLSAELRGSLKKGKQ